MSVVSKSGTNLDPLDPLMSNSNAMAELDPLWAILSDPEKKSGRWNLEEFFNDGDREAKRVVGTCKANGVDDTHIAPDIAGERSTTGVDRVLNF